MRLTYGAWQLPEGLQVISMQRCYRVRQTESQLELVALDRMGEGGDRFEGIALTATLSTPMPDVVRVRIVHHAGSTARPDGFDLRYELEHTPQIHRSEDQIDFRSGSLILCTSTGRWATRFLADGKELLRGEGLGIAQPRGQHKRLFQRLSLGVGESIYGLGERFGPFVKNGQSIAIWNEDPGTNSDLAYKNVPLYLSNRGYGVFVNSPGRVEFEIASERTSQVQFSVEGDVLDYYLIYGPEPKQVLEKYTRLAGRPALPPAWSFGLWLSTSFTTKYDEATVTDFVEQMATRDLPLSVFHFDCFWMRERHWCDFEWDPSVFPDPVGMLARLRNRGLKVCVWINPYVSQLSDLFREGDEGGYFLKRANGDVYQRDQWQPGMALVDFTNPAAVQWYQSKLRTLLHAGVDCFKTDFGERIPTDAVYFDRSDPNLMHNYYSYLYNKAVFDVVSEVKGATEAMVFARSATAGCQKFPVHWGGDCFATWESMAENLRGGLCFGLSGGGFWSHDIGGFAGKADSELFKRWIAFGMLSSHSRLHGSESYRVPWNYDEESVDVLRYFSRLKNRLFPYLYGAAHEASREGTPVMRAMMLEFPHDPNCRHLDRQYMLGSSLLVAPVFSPDGAVQFYVPEGDWIDWLTHERYIGGRWYERKCGPMQIPLLVRPGSVIPTSNEHGSPRWNVGDPIALHVHAFGGEASFSALLGQSESSETVRLAAERRSDALVLRTDRPLPAATVRLSGHTVAKVIEGGERVDASTARWTVPQGPLVLRLSEIAPPSRIAPPLENT